MLSRLFGTKKFRLGVILILVGILLATFTPALGEESHGVIPEILGPQDYDIWIIPSVPHLQIDFTINVIEGNLHVYFLAQGDYDKFIAGRPFNAVLSESIDGKRAMSLQLPDYGLYYLLYCDQDTTQFVTYVIEKWTITATDVHSLIVLTFVPLSLGAILLFWSLLEIRKGLPKGTPELSSVFSSMSPKRYSKTRTFWTLILKELSNFIELKTLVPLALISAFEFYIFFSTARRSSLGEFGLTSIEAAPPSSRTSVIKRMANVMMFDFYVQFNFYLLFVLLMLISFSFAYFVAGEHERELDLTLFSYPIGKLEYVTAKFLSHYVIFTLVFLSPAVLGTLIVLRRFGASPIEAISASAIPFLAFALIIFAACSVAIFWTVLIRKTLPSAILSFLALAFWTFLLYFFMPQQVESPAETSESYLLYMILTLSTNHSPPLQPMAMTFLTSILLFISTYIIYKFKEI